MSGEIHERYEELAVGHALHTLEPEEDLLAVEHLRACEHCRRLAADTEAVGAELAVLAPPVEPPAALGERLRAAVAAEPRGSVEPAERAGRGAPVQSAGPAGGRGPVGPPEQVLPREPGDQVRALPPRASRRGASSRPPRGPRPRGLLRAAPWLVTAAAVAALAVVTGWGTSTSAERDRLLRAADLQEQVLDRLADPSARVVRLAEQDGAAGGASAAVLLDEGGRAYVVVDGLAPNDPRSTYVLWQVPEGGTPQAVGVFDVASDELAVAEVGAVTVDPGALAALAVSREAGRTAPPTPSTPLLVGTPV